MATAASVSPNQATSRFEARALLRAVWNSYIFRKILRTFITIFVVTTIIFFLIRLLPGNPIEIYVNQLVVTYGIPYHEALDQAAALFAIDLDQPVFLQYISYLKNMLQGNLGMSVLSPGTTVTEVIVRFLPWTLFSVGLGLTISFIIGITLGVMMAYRRDSLLDHGLTVFSSLMSSV
nr:ABC transporter permease [Caldilineaceae bacterium]